MTAEHILQLKALLDTEQVQQQLQKLKDQGLGGFGQFQVPSGSGKLDANIQKLSGQLNQLNQSIQTLARNTQRAVAASQKAAVRGQAASGFATRGIIQRTSSAGEEKDSFYNFIRNKRVAAFLGGHIIGGFGDFIKEQGYSKTGTVVKGLGSGIYAGAGAAYFSHALGASQKASGRIGMAFGIATAAFNVVKGLNDLKEAAEKAAEAQREYVKQQRQRGFDLAESRKLFFDQKLADYVVKVENTDIAQKRLDYSKWVEERQDQKLQNMEDPNVFASRIRKKAEQYKEDYRQGKSGYDSFADAMSSAGFRLGINEIKDTEMAIDQAANKVIEQYQERFKNALKEAQAASATARLWESVNESLKQTRQKVEDNLSKMRVQEARRKTKVLENSREYDREFRYDDQTRKTQIFANETVDEDSRLSPMQQFDKLAAELDKLREQRNASLKEAYGITRQLMLRPKELTAGQYEDLDKRRELVLKDAENFGQRANILETALTRIQNKVAAPDLSHVTSLSQYGFGMGEKDDTVQVMQKYYSKMESLTRAIKDKIEQGITTTAVYSD